MLSSERSPSPLPRPLQSALIRIRRLLPKVYTLRLGAAMFSKAITKCGPFFPRYIREKWVEFYVFISQYIPQCVEKV